MNTLSSRRILIASLFLPETAIPSPHDSDEPSPHPETQPLSPSLHDATPSHTRQPEREKNIPGLAQADQLLQTTDGLMTLHGTPQPLGSTSDGGGLIPTLEGLMRPATLSRRPSSSTHDMSIVDDLRDKIRQSVLSPSSQLTQTPSTSTSDNPFQPSSPEIPRYSTQSQNQKDAATQTRLSGVSAALRSPSSSLQPAVLQQQPPLSRQLSEVSESHTPSGTRTPNGQRRYTTTHAGGTVPTRLKRRTSSRSFAPSTGTRTRSQSCSSRDGRSDEELHSANTSGRAHLETKERDQTTIVPNPHCNGGLRNAVSSVEDRLRKKVWIGTLGTSTDHFTSGVREEVDRRLLDERSSISIWIPDSEFESMYDEFCHQILWPTLHYAVPDAITKEETLKFFEREHAFGDYVRVNERFADVVAREWREGDVVWINDYHLMLLPLLIRKHPVFADRNKDKGGRKVDVPIGFFMHVAFPSSEIFRCLSCRAPLLRGILAADLVGFQTANNARHFRQTVSRILSYETLPKGIQIPPDDPDDALRGRFVDVGVFPMGIDVEGLREKRNNPEVGEWVEVLTQRYKGMKIVVGRDKLDAIQGVRQKIQAFECFLDRFPEFQEKVVLIQVALQTTELNELAGGVADVVAHINAKYSSLTYQPVVFLHTQDLTFSQYLALLTVADAFLVTSLREGMALRTHEFVECQEERHRPLVLSEFTGSYSYSGFRSCIAINPWDKRGTAEAINYALTMSDEEAAERWEDLHTHVNTQTAQAFVSSFLTQCLRAHGEHMHRIGGAGNVVPELSVKTLETKWKQAAKRKIFLDLEGMLWQRDTTVLGLTMFENSVQRGTFRVPNELVNLVRTLALSEENEVWLLSGLKVRGVLEKLAEEMGTDVGIVAENGCFLKPCGSDEWMDRIVNHNLDWKGPCLEILNYFTERTPGSLVEERDASIVWRFWTFPNPNAVPCNVDDCPTETDRVWARRQAAEAQNHIYDSLGERYNLRIIPGGNSFLILPNSVSRSAAVGTILTPNASAMPPTPLSRSRASSGPADRATPSWMTKSGVSYIGGNLHSTPPMRESIMSALSMSPLTEVSSKLEIEEDALSDVKEVDELIVCMSADEKLIRRLNEFGEMKGADGENFVTICTSGRGTDAKWRLDVGKVRSVVKRLSSL